MFSLNPNLTLKFAIIVAIEIDREREMEREEKIKKVFCEKGRSTVRKRYTQRGERFMKREESATIKREKEKVILGI